jgi:methylated-DNA-protein-cysteine methyltransferase-like protein
MVLTIQLSVQGTANLPSPSTDRSKTSATFHSSNVPWQRVINAKGGISPRSVTLSRKSLLPVIHRIDKEQRGPDTGSHQADALRREGVEVREDAMRQYSVDLAQYGWFPDTLPSENGAVESSNDEDGEDIPDA